MNFGSLRAGLKKLHNAHVYIAFDAAMVTAWVRWAPSLAAYFIFAAIWLLVALDVLELYIRKFSGIGRVLAAEGIL